MGILTDTQLRDFFNKVQKNVTKARADRHAAVMANNVEARVEAELRLRLYTVIVEEAFVTI